MRRTASRWSSGASSAYSRGRSTRSRCSSTICNGWTRRRSTCSSTWSRTLRCGTSCWSAPIETTRSSPRTRLCGRSGRSAGRRQGPRDRAGAALARRCGAARRRHSLLRPGARPAAWRELVHEKTAGNPFFAIQFISALAEEGLLAFDSGAACWTWDLDRIRAKGFTDNVVDLMVGKLSRLSAATRQALKQLACLGNVAEIATLSTVHGAQKRKSTRPSGRLLAQDSSCVSRAATRFFTTASKRRPMRSFRKASAQRYTCELAGCSPPRHALERARREDIRDRKPAQSRSGLITYKRRSASVAELNMIAGKKAKASTAYKSALNYFAAGTALLGDDPGRMSMTWPSTSDSTGRSANI